MKKIMFGIAGVIAVISSANALTEEECRKSSKMYWVSANKECVPRNVCDSKFKGKYDEIYCIRDFARTATESVTEAQKWTLYYLQNVIGKGADINCDVNIPGAGDKQSTFGQNFIPCITADGRYFVFEFDDTTDNLNWGGDARFPERVFGPLCKSLGGEPSKGGSHYQERFCYGLTEEKCSTLGTQINDIIPSYSTKFDVETKYCRTAYKIRG